MRTPPSHTTFGSECEHLRAIRHLDQNENTSEPYKMSWHTAIWKAL